MNLWSSFHTHTPHLLFLNVLRQPSGSGMALDETHSVEQKRLFVTSPCLLHSFFWHQTKSPESISFQLSYPHGKMMPMAERASDDLGPPVSLEGDVLGFYNRLQRSQSGGVRLDTIHSCID